MSTEPQTRPPRVIPVARPAHPTLVAAASAEPDAILDDPAPAIEVTPEAIQGWAWSIVLHGLFLLLLGFWYFAPKENSPQTIDARLAGSEFGLESGTDLHGGLDTPLGPPEGMLAPPLEPTLTAAKTADVVLDPKLSGLTGTPSASAGGGREGGNPGVGDGEGFGIARFGHGGENVNGVEVKVGDPQFTLLWRAKAKGEPSNTDIDLHVIEPGGAEIYWEVRQGKRGGELDVDDVDGEGPENIYWLDEKSSGEKKVFGKGPLGEYKWFVEYYGGNHGIPQPTAWTVRVKHAGKVEIYRGELNRVGQRSQIYTLKLSEPRHKDPLLQGLFDDLPASKKAR